MATRKAITLVSGLFQEVNTPTDKLDFAGNTTADLGEIQIYILQMQDQEQLFQ